MCCFTGITCAALARSRISTSARLQVMGFHVEHAGDHERLHRAGTYDTLADAIAAASRLPVRPVVVLEAADGLVQFGAGTLAGAVLEDGSVVERPEQPQWWSQMAEGAQAQLLENGGQPLSSNLLAEITLAGGTASMSYWNGDSSTGGGFHLSDSAADWLLAERARRAVLIGGSPSTHPA